MWDGWETTRGCTRRTIGELRGYCRTFNKASVRNWGSKESPCPTLNLRADDFEVCQGVAFEFPDHQKFEILEYLILREGKGFELHELPINFDDNVEVLAHVPIYTGKNTISVSLAEAAIMVSTARGIEGSCSAYLSGICNKLFEMEIKDRTVVALIAALKDDSQK